MIAISFQFLAGRYHATPWGRHVNEGAVEWPPSPWRILRAVVATWKRTLPDLPQERVEPILRALVEPPEFFLPPASTGHTRHFMPWDKGWRYDKQHPRTLVFDTFVAVPRHARLLARWPTESLDDTQRGTLVRILGNLNTLGRSESWCEAELADGAEEPNWLMCRRLEGDAPQDHEIVRLLCCDGDSTFNTNIFTDQTKKKPKRTAPAYDPDWHLCAETLWLHDEKWSDPPGSRWIRYARPRNCFKIESRASPRRAGQSRRIHIVRYALDSTVLPLVTETLPVAETARRALMGIHGRLTEKNGVRGRSDVLAGKNEHDQPLVGHRHAYYLPTDEDGDGRLDHLTVYAAGGFDSDEWRAFDRLRELRAGRDAEERHPLRLLLLGMGALGEYRPGPLLASKVWVSMTPYIATHYAKTRGRKRIEMASPEARAAFLQDDLRAQLTAVRPDLAGGGAPDVTIEALWDDHHVFKVAERWRTIQFKRFRRKAGDDGGRRLTGAFRLIFSLPVPGPISLGFSSHFGMGLFMPLDRRAETPSGVIGRERPGVDSTSFWHFD